MSGLFEPDELPTFVVPLPQAELRLLSSLPEWPTIQEVDDTDQPAMRRLERLGLVRVSREKTDPISTFTTPFAGRAPQ